MAEPRTEIVVQEPIRDRVLIALGVVRGTLALEEDLGQTALMNLRDLLKDVADEMAQL